MNNSSLATQNLLDKGTLSFTIESRILRELGERLVKQPEVAVVELVKNSYDADASKCVVAFNSPESVTVSDDGIGMTLDRFIEGWMRIGTSSKEESVVSEKFVRLITGEKGIGRFAVRFLGRELKLESIADDPDRGVRTLLTANFDWPNFDRNEDLGQVQVPYELVKVEKTTGTGTKLEITRLRSVTNRLNLNTIRTGSIGILSPLRSLFREMSAGANVKIRDRFSDPGFTLELKTEDSSDEIDDVASQILNSFVLRAWLSVNKNKINLRIYCRNSKKPYLEITDSYPNEIGKLNADIRFFPRRAGTFTNMPLDGRRAQRWITNNHGVAVFDRNFRVPPYGYRGNDWLQLQADAARNRRDPRSELAKKHFQMTQPVKSDTSLNWMLRLPQSLQLVGLVQVQAHRSKVSDTQQDEMRLIASADRQGFVENTAFEQLQDLVRGAVEAIAFVDRQLQIKEEEAEHRAQVAAIQEQTKAAISELEANPGISARAKAQLIGVLAETQRMVEKQEESSKEREQQLEVMSLLGVVAGFMTHEFDAALKKLEQTHKELLKIANTTPKFGEAANQFSLRIKQLKEFVTYSKGYIQGARVAPAKPYPVRPRLRQVQRVFGKYAEDRNIQVQIMADAELIAPPVPVSLYNGLALNLYTNALKAVTAKLGRRQGKIAFRAWNDGRWHYLEVSDTGIGIPSALRERVFDPLFTTTDSRNDPMGSGMGLGLALVKRGAEAFGGNASVVDPPGEFSTCVRVRLPLATKETQHE